VLASQLQICEKLRLVNTQQMLDSFQFDHNFVGNNEADAIERGCLPSFVNDGKLHLSSEWEVAQAKFLAHTLLVTDSRRPGPN